MQEPFAPKPDTLVPANKESLQEIIIGFMDTGVADLGLHITKVGLVRIMTKLHLQPIGWYFVAVVLGYIDM